MYPTPINIPEQTVGDCTIKHEWENGRKIHRLISQQYGLWMSDNVLEIKQMKEAVEVTKAKGKGLVGGLGLGVVIEFLGERPGVTQIDVVDNSQDTVDLVLPYLKWRAKCNIIIEDIFKFVQELKTWDYDFAILDTWQGIGKEVWLLQVMPLRRMLANKFGKVNLYNWTEDTMFDEMIELLTTRKPYWILDELPMPMTKKDAKWFLQNVGLPEWEKKYGDKVYDKYKTKAN